MLHTSSSCPPLHSLLFQLNEAELMIQAADSSSITRTTQDYTLLIFTGGNGQLNLDDQSVILSTDKCYLLSPGISYSTDNQELTLYYYLITFTAIYTTEHPKRYSGELLSGRRELIVHPFTKVIRLVEDLLMNRNNTDDVQQFKRQLKFQELLLLLFEHNYPSKHLPSPTESVEKTITFIQEHYTESITVKQLAELAGISIWQYTPIFQQLTGKKPLEYLTDLRINHSKRFLQESTEPLREIARLVGFSDEYYFSRRFRQKTGVTPGQYAHQQSRKLTVKDWTGHEVEIPERAKRIVYHGETLGDLLALGVKPIGGDEAFARNSVYKHRLKKLANVGFPLDPQLTASLNPDLIILANSDERAYRAVSGIAPTLTFDSFASLDNRMRTLGSWLGKQREAEAWLESFTIKNAAMWQQLYTTTLQVGETASALVYDHGDHLYAMGMSGFSTALYAPCGLQPTEEIQAILDEELGFAEVDPTRLPAYAGDHIFMLIPERKDSRAAMERLLDSSLWNNLPAVRQGHVYLLDGSKWNSSDALTREKLLTLLPKLLGGSSANN
ncbi:Fe3+-hydroxamate ABC transporter substrate-binding protein [Paenibacillus odorifer]|uniref:AraC family transcriptional regulator n=1 Tax=Paenibacillus TaxID=44249 RepID=UPI00096ECE8B|nr:MULTISPECIES: AraC family transcriptional regulator [Paenibacillus]MDH6426585.1 ABC-type Fe3+-hydroxamate transport system substrate-binding protein [Paenibacillus sp. PastH-4]MDH6442609.1 ABC-type Fe3+-hydroxamate transport system substrate-binding protein [Paenibacillus sp. PastF-4]MDH6526679.1 ABC-type Fe3+-hydroxamate transport system substrate-binding protein [Paenibacillus sp. PastH-3]OMD62106.1 Fe3+-hydroxamate ABC transporter substrate-binding protein [Paenibacillus odorifer]